MRQLVEQDPVVGSRIREGPERRHLDKVGTGRVARPSATMTDDCARPAREPLTERVAFMLHDRLDGRSEAGRVQPVALLDVEHVVAARFIRGDSSFDRLRITGVQDQGDTRGEAW